MHTTSLRSALTVAIGTILAIGLTPALVLAQTPSIPLSGLNGNNGFRFDGAADEEASAGRGRPVGAAGDINGDGIDDLIAGAWGGDNATGRSYVIFGSRIDFPSTLKLSELDGSRGFAMHGEASFDGFGGAVSGTGDINGDGLDDLIVGAATADPEGVYAAGRSYVVFGRSTSFASPLRVSNLDGNNGFTLDGELASDFSGVSVSASGDLNGDGFDDLAVTALGRGTYGSTRTYVLFGRSIPFSASLGLSSLTGSTGVTLSGAATAVDAAGDINGDGLDDLVIGEPTNGRSYVQYGRTSGFTSPVDLNDPNAASGFVLNGESGSDLFGQAVGGAGDVNGDGIDDLIVSAPRHSATGLSFTGRTYVVFGQNGGFTSPVELSSLNGSNGFALDGEASYDFSGYSVSAAGDVNGDGLDDILVGASNADINGDGSGRSYLVFGRRTGFPTPLALSNLSAGLGIAFDGLAAWDASGDSLSSAGDINGDGIDDLVISASGAVTEGNSRGGHSYVLFGKRRGIFRDGLESENVETSFPRLTIRSTAEGGSVRWQTGAKCDCDLADFNFNVSVATGGNLAFSWPAVDAARGGVTTNGAYAVLQPGAMIGPSASFSVDASTAVTSEWRAGVDGYLGFRFTNSVSGQVNYGYAHLQSTAPTGYPIEIVSVHVNITGLPVTIRAN